MKLPLLITIVGMSVLMWAQMDGPATLPKSTPATTFVFPNPPKSVAATDSLQVAINAASCGDTLNVDPASITTVAGKLVLPTCTSTMPLNIENAAATVLDNATSRVVPGQQLPKIILGNSNSSIVGGAFVRLAGFEITRLSNTGIVYNLINPGVGAHDLIFDMLYCHGTSTDETARCFALSNSTNVAITNSYISDFHCMSGVGVCTDAQAISGGCDTQDSGNYLIQNNYLEGSAENIVLGGCGATKTPTDITIRSNTMVKPVIWNPSDPSFKPAMGKDGLAHPWIVKNCFELKNADRVLFEDNTCSNVWGGFTQVGYAILLTAKNQNNVCPICKVTNVTVRSNTIDYVGLAMQIGIGPSDAGGWPADEGWISIHDNAFHVQYKTCYQCNKIGVFQISMGLTNLPTGLHLHDVYLGNNTISYDHGVSATAYISIGGPTATSGYTQMSNINIVNNVFPQGVTPWYFTGGGPLNCVYSNTLKSYSTTFAACFTGNSSFTGNVILTPGPKQSSSWPPITTYPAGNFVVPAGVTTN